MKIKELHLRNIASIESADINFETGLNEQSTGKPATIFLISGDTGTGKSVILDGISMALYKKTPRLTAVANKKNNTFTDKEGTIISINSIEQYTRLGISEKDDSYSEVVFEGNDGKTYHARLTLGFKRTKNKDKDGNRLLKYSSPEWTVKVGTDDWQKVESTTGQPILGAIGLTFEQFGRMAMLAQGQFASFLTGDKNERESILEQLTNTEHFTQYGNAINSLFKQAKEVQNVAQATFNTEKEHTLPKEEIEKLKLQYEELEREEKELKNHIDTNEFKLNALELIERSNIQKAESLGQLQKYEHIKAGDEYIRKVQFIKDWEQTTTERQRHSDMLKAQKELQNTRAEEEQLKEKLRQLISDLKWRQKELHEQQRNLTVQKEWLTRRATCDNLYTHYREAVLLLEQYKGKSQELDTARKTLTDESTKTNTLIGKVESAKAEATQAQTIVDNKQREIDAINTRCNALQPAIVNNRLNELSKETSALHLLNERISSHHDKLNKAEKDKTDILQKEAELVRYNASMETAMQLFASAREKSEEANARLTTMSSSLEETLTNLRERLFKEHEEYCPLCGQKLKKIHAEEEFRMILSPIKQEQQAAEMAYKDAEKHYDKAKTEYNTFVGILAGKKQHLEELYTEIKDDERNIRNTAKQLQIEIANTLVPTEAIAIVQVALEEKDKEEKELKERQQECLTLQKKTDVLYQEMKPLDIALRKTMQEKTNAENALTKNQEIIARYKELCHLNSQILSDLTNSLANQFGDTYPNWMDNIDKTIHTLANDATEYQHNMKRYEEDCSVFEKGQTLVRNLQSQAETLNRAILEDNHTNQELQPFPTQNISIEWSQFIRDISSLNSKISSYNDIIRDCQQILYKYYTTSGKTEEYLLDLIQRESELEPTREFIKEVDECVKTFSATIDVAEKNIKEAMNKLNISNDQDIPEKALLSNLKTELTNKYTFVISQKAFIKQKLDENEKNIEKRNKAEKELEEANKNLFKWDTLNRYFGGTRFRTLVQTYVLRPLLNNANIYLEKITDRYHLTCSQENEQLSILVHDLYNKGQVRSATLLSGGERFMISLALSLALSSLNRPDMNVNILFIDEGFGTLDEKNLDSVMSTLEKLQEIAGQSNRRVGIISHREELDERIPVQIQVKKRGEGRSLVITKNR